MLTRLSLLSLRHEVHLSQSERVSSQLVTKYQVVGVLGTDEDQYGVHGGPDDQQQTELDHRQQRGRPKVALDQDLVPEVADDHAGEHPQNDLDAHRTIPSLSSA